MKNKDLKQLYDDVYREGEHSFFSKYVGLKNTSETDEAVLSCTDWQRKVVLDVGCGTGKIAYLISQSGAKKVTGIDYSKEAIKKAKATYGSDNLDYVCMDLNDWEDEVDIVVSCGTVEHTEDPRETLVRFGRLICQDGQIIITCPCFLNIRGFIWMALQSLLDVPMSLSDLHFISPFDIEQWLRDTSLGLMGVKTFDDSMGNGGLMLVDLRKRLTNALKDANLKNDKVGEFVDWLEKVVDYRKAGEAEALEGATALYIIKHQTR